MIQQMVDRYPGFDAAPYLQANSMVPPITEPEANAPSSTVASSNTLTVRNTKSVVYNGGPPVASSRWVLPDMLSPSRDGKVATPAQVSQWRDHGWLFVDGLLPPNLVDAAVAAAAELFPTALREKMDGDGGEAMGEA
eukprot:SAG31_NODE_11089_length_1067_cov_0.836777_1_plen_136_part_10